MAQHRLPMLPSAGEVSWGASVNGVKKQLNIENNAILLDVLRDQAGSLGTKRGCDMGTCLLYTSPSPRDVEESRMPSSA